MDVDTLIAPKRFGKGVLLGLVANCLGATFQIAQIEYSEWVLLGGLISLALFYTLRYCAKLSKRNLDTTRLFFILSFVLSRVFSIWHLPGSQFFQILFFVVILAFIALEINHKDNPQRQSNDDSLYRRGLIFLRLAMILWAIGILFKIQHWPYASYLLMLGFAFISVWAVRNAFAKGEV